MCCGGVRKRRHLPGRAGGTAGVEGVTGGGGSWLLQCHPHPACFCPWGQKEHQHPQHRSPSPQGAGHPMAALHWGGRDGGCTGQLRVSCRKLSFQDKGDQQLEDVHLQKHWGHGWEGGTARGVPTVVGGYGGQHGDRAGDASGTCWPLQAWLSVATRGENADLDFSLKLVVGDESVEGLGLVVVVVPAGGHQVQVLVSVG